ncbi:mediator of RNA polymerase II transcription subunit 26 [Synchiropus splendidus]|uniref:mediator of RNA polymerase II transcription subunit 26 n=1 Tax=Synchiropus splendidus TaxID=270530 RepID=UPI00237DA3A0|nr:mediator of RNA polymerase II transcription subunit 26 [Synchiropus splendidus]
MTTVSATPQQMRDRLLQAIDRHSNICNMVVVLEVITCLEKYPITKEALEETRLGKLINDVRKKTKDEDLAKRAKKLLRNWQKLIEPGPTVNATLPGSTNGSSHPCRTDTSPPDVSVSGKGVPEVKIRNDVHNTYSPKAEKSGSRKRRAENRDSGVYLPEKISKMSYDNSVSPPPTNGIAGSPDTLPDQEVVPSPDRSRVEHLDNDKINRIPVNAVKPRPSSPGMAKLPSTSSLSKVAVMQQQARLDDGGGGSCYPTRSPRGLTASPRSAKPDNSVKRSAAFTPKGASVHSPSSRKSPMPSSQPAFSPAQSSYADKLPHASHRSAMHWSSSTDVQSHRSPQDPSASLESPSSSPSPSQPLNNSELHRTVSEAPAVGSDDTEGTPMSNLDLKRRKYRPRDYSVNLDGQKFEDTTKPVRLKERRLTFDPVTGQIKPLVHKEPSQTEDAPSPCPTPEPAESRQRTDIAQPAAPVTTPGPSPNPFCQTNWNELSRNEIIQSYLNRQSNVLTSSGVQAPSAHFFMSEYLKREEKTVTETRKTHVLQTDSFVGDLPGVSREVTDEDMDRIHTQHWPGVNGCLDTKGTWYDWTECISLDPHGDESKLNILPYVCLD